jgi:hypothetical protein
MTSHLSSTTAREGRQGQGGGRSCQDISLKPRCSYGAHTVQVHGLCHLDRQRRYPGIKEISSLPQPQCPFHRAEIDAPVPHVQHMQQQLNIAQHAARCAHARQGSAAQHREQRHAEDMAAHRSATQPVAPCRVQRCVIDKEIARQRRARGLPLPRAHLAPFEMLSGGAFGKCKVRGGCRGRPTS